MSLPQFNLWENKKKQEQEEEGEKINAQSCSQPIQCAQLSTFLISKNKQQKNNQKQRTSAKAGSQNKCTFETQILGGCSKYEY
jgi:hypothetical protein